MVFAKNENIPNPAAFVKDTFHPDFEISSLQKIRLKIVRQNIFPNQDLYFQIDDYIQSKTKKVCKDMPRIYRNMKEHLLELKPTEVSQSPLTAST